MAYNRRNLLRRIIDIQEITLEHTTKGVTQEWVYVNVINPLYHISRACYYEYLGTNARKELKILENESKKQLKLFDLSNN